jgi:hypothetical protein
VLYLQVVDMRGGREEIISLTFLHKHYLNDYLLSLEAHK